MVTIDLDEEMVDQLEQLDKYEDLNRCHDEAQITTDTIEAVVRSQPHSITTRS